MYRLMRAVPNRAFKRGPLIYISILCSQDISRKIIGYNLIIFYNNDVSDYVQVNE